MKKRKASTLVELIIVIIISAIFISAVYMGINVVIRSLEYAKRVVYKMYHENQIEISLEILNLEIQNAGSMVSVVRNLEKFKTKTLDGNLSRGILSEKDDEFYIQYAVTNTFMLKDTESGTYVKIIKNATELDVVDHNSKRFWHVLTTDGFKESTATALKLTQASLTNLGNNKYKAPDDYDTFVFFVYTPEIEEKLLEVNSKLYYGEKIAQSIFTYSATDNTLKLSKYLPFIDEVIETTLLNNLESFEVLYGISETTSDISYKDYKYLNDNNYWDILKTLKISFTTKLPRTEEILTTEKIFWLPEGDS